MSEYIIDMSNSPYQSKSGLLYADVEQLRGETVRCRDCRHAWNDEGGRLRCNGYLVAPWDYYNDEPSDGEIVGPDGFCAWEERREA